MSCFDFYISRKWIYLTAAATYSVLTWPSSEICRFVILRINHKLIMRVGFYLYSFYGLVVLRIRICRIQMFLGLLDPDRIRQSEVWIRILLSSSKNSKKNLDSYYFVTSYCFLSLKNDVNLPSKVISKSFFSKLVFCSRLEGQWRNNRIWIRIRIQIRIRIH